MLGLKDLKGGVRLDYFRKKKASMNEVNSGAKIAVTYSGTRFAIGFMPCSSLDSVIKTNEKALLSISSREL